MQNSFESEYFADIVVVPSFGNNDDIVKNFNSLNQSFSFSSTMTYVLETNHTYIYLCGAT